jgi:hypothetical protein
MISRTCFDKNGVEISFHAALVLFEDKTYRRVAWTKLADGKYVSTVWLGPVAMGPTQIFECMAFGPEGEELDCARLATIEEAKARHEVMVAKWGGAA